MIIALAAVATAHMAMEEPLPRYPSDGNSANKACPCGVGQSNRFCDVASDRSDPDRSAFITTYAPGETVTMRWRETIGHAGRWRVAFDPDGADMADFNQTILLDIADPSGSTGNTGNGDEWEVEFTLPQTPCDNCTLQLVQIMDGNTTDPVPDPIGRSSYYQCADIVISEIPVDTAAPDEPSVPTDTAYVDDKDDFDTADGGCGCSSTGGSLGVLAFLPLVFAGRRRVLQEDRHSPS